MLTQTIDKAVENQKMQNDCRLMYAHLNTWRMDERREGREEGREEGIAWQKAQSQAEIDRMASTIEQMAAEIAALKANASLPRTSE